MDLADALKLMAQIKDIIPIKLENLASGFQELQSTARIFSKDTNTRQEEVIAILGKSKVLLDKIPEQLQENESRLDNYVADLEKSIQLWQASFADCQEDLNQRTRVIYEELESFKEQFYEGMNQRSTRQEEAEKALQALQRTLYQKQELFEVTFIAVEQEISNFQQEINSSSERLTEQMDSLDREFERHQEEIASIVQKFLDLSLDKLQENLDKDTENIQENFFYSTSNLRKSMEVNIERKLKSVLEKNLEQYEEQLTSLQALTEIEIPLEEVGDKFNLMGDLSPEVLDLIEQIEQAKDSLGIDD